MLSERAIDGCTSKSSVNLIILLPLQKLKESRKLYLFYGGNMRTLSRRQKGVTLDIWPGFVDALATLLIVMIFALMIFVVSQIYLSDALQDSKRGLESLESKLH